MPLTLTTLTSDTEFTDLTHCEFLSFEHPDCRLKELFFPTYTTRTAAIEEAVTRQTAWHRSDPTSTWVKVVDTDSDSPDQVLGAGLWHVYDQNPYAGAAEEGGGGGGSCDWFAEGEDREVADKLMRQFLTPRMTYMQKPHVFLDICFTHPDARRRGVGKLIMDWGVNEADKRDYDMYIDATDLGRRLYSTYGFIEGEAREFTMTEEDGFARTDRLKELEAQLLPFKWWPMYRPNVSKREGGGGEVVVVPWGRR